MQWAVSRKTALTHKKNEIKEIKKKKCWRQALVAVHPVLNAITQGNGDRGRGTS